MENPDETADKEPSHLDLHCLQMCVRIYLMSEFTRLYPTSGGLFLTIGSNYSIDEYMEVRSNICNYMYLYFVVENVIFKTCNNS